MNLEQCYVPKDQRINVLFVDDDQYGTYQLTQELAYDSEISLTLMRAPHAALGYAVDHTVDVLVTDRMMPPGNLSKWETKEGFFSGSVLAREIKQAKPRVKIVMISNAAADDNVRSLLGNKIIERYFSKQEITLTPGHFVKTIKRIYRNVCAPIRTFIVHGHDDPLILDLKSYVSDRLGWPTPVVLADLPSATKTIIEKFEDQAADTDVVFVLLTPEDGGPRPNVMLELGFFLGRFGRRSGRVVLLKQGDIPIPSDMHGMIYIDITNGLGHLSDILHREVPYYFR